MINDRRFELADDVVKKTYAYEELIQSCDGVDGIKMGTTQKTSLAWLVEEISKDNPVQWQQKVREIRDEIIKLNGSSGKIGVSHFLSRIISEKYLGTLEGEIMKEENVEKKKGLEEMVKMVSSQLDNLKEREEKNEATSFGGVSIRRTPAWFPKK